MSASRTRIVCLPFGYSIKPSESVLSSLARGILKTMSRSSESTTTSIRSTARASPPPMQDSRTRSLSSRATSRVSSSILVRDHSMRCTRCMRLRRRATRCCGNRSWEGIYGQIRPDQGCPQACLASTIGPLPPGVQARRPRHRGRRRYPRQAFHQQVSDCVGRRLGLRLYVSSIFVRAHRNYSRAPPPPPGTHDTYDTGPWR